MENFRTYGNAPFTVAVLHGGPGAAGSMAPVARELSRTCGVLEPLQTAASIEGQAEELRQVLEKHGRLPVTLIGHSWGAWLGIIFAARHPALVKKLILVGCGPLEVKYAIGIMETRLSRLGLEERKKAHDLMEALNDPAIEDKSALFARFGELMSKADSFNLLPNTGGEEGWALRESVYQSVWREAEELRRSGGLLSLARKIRCPVTAIHGDHDPHPAEGVEKPLKRAVKDFRFILLKDCGHEPWKERAAKEEFYTILKREIG